MRKLRLTRESSLLLAQRRVARLEARVSALEARGARRWPPAGGQPDPKAPMPSAATRELARCLWICAVLLVAAVLVTAGLVYWGTRT